MEPKTLHGKHLFATMYLSYTRESHVSMHHWWRWTNYLMRGGRECTNNQALQEWKELSARGKMTTRGNLSEGKTKVEPFLKGNSDEIDQCPPQLVVSFSRRQPHIHDRPFQNRDTVFSTSTNCSYDIGVKPTPNCRTILVTCRCFLRISVVEILVSFSSRSSVLCLCFGDYPSTDGVPSVAWIRGSRFGHSSKQTLSSGKN